MRKPESKRKEKKGWGHIAECVFLGERRFWKEVTTFARDCGLGKKKRGEVGEKKLTKKHLCKKKGLKFEAREH